MKHLFKKGNVPKNKVTLQGRYNKLTVIRELEVRKGGHIQWECRCDCGNTVCIIATHIKTGKTKSCGCLIRETMQKRMQTEKPNLKHGMRKTRLYKIWNEMKYRCNNPRFKDYHNYGGRGIGVEWKSFEEFRDDMYESYNNHVKEFGEKDTSIDRIDCNGGYSKENCRWATMKVQQRNRTNNRMVTIGGNTKCITEWQDIFGISKGMFDYRVYSKGWSPEKALTTPIKRSIR